MRAEIKCYGISDSYSSNDDFFNLELEIGFVGSKGSELFTVDVCTPAALARMLEYNGPEFHQKMIVTNDLRLESIVSFIKRTLSEFEEDNWDDLARRLATLFSWEFDNYKN